jgi:hypothetical protein
MQPQFFSSMAGNVYHSIWSKYRPAILQLMIASENQSQEYRLFDHEFKALQPKEKDYSFEFRAHKGKSLNKTTLRTNAKDLLEVLNMSRKATELMDESEFEFVLDKKFILHITRI